MVVMKTWPNGVEAKAIELQVLDVYTDIDGNLVLRLEGENDYVLISFDQVSINSLKQGLKDNQRLRPDRGYPDAPNT